MYMGIKMFFIILVILFLIPFSVYAKTGNHFGEQKFLEYSIEYLEPMGITRANENGIFFIPNFPYLPSFSSTVLPERYFGEYSLYFTGWTMPFCVNIENVGNRTFHNLKVEAFQEFLNINGGEGELIGDDNGRSWVVDKLVAKEEVRLCSEFEIPETGSSGIDQTHLIISHSIPSVSGRGEVILEDYQAGLWCPVE